jgi:putative SOS response-associated peptidase YedK
VFAFAGIWDRWKNSQDPQAPPIESFSILTTKPNALTGAVHDRMPVILPPEHHDLWLDPGFSDVSALTELLQPFEARSMKKFPVSKRVNSVANDDAACSQPTAEMAPAVDPQRSLFG